MTFDTVEAKREEKGAEEEPIHVGYDPTSNSCAWCYAVLADRF